MSRLIFACLAVLAALSLSGCAFLNSLDRNLERQVDVWMKQHEYARVIDTLRYIGPSNPNYKSLQRKRQLALAESKKYEQTEIARAMTLMEKGEWYEADITLQDAMDKLPPSMALDKTYRDFSAARDQHLKDLYCALYRNKADWLIMNRPVQEQLKKTQPDASKTQRIFSQYDNDTTQVYAELLDCGKDAAGRNDLQLALHSYKLASKLRTDKALNTTLARLQQVIDRKRAVTQSGQAQALSQLGQNLLDKSKQALAAGDLKLAIRHYEKIPDADKQLPPVVAYDADMNRRIHENVRQGIELGRKLYSQGQVEQALAVWKKLRDIDPDNENLLKHIERAERVLDKIKQLRKEQTQSSTSQPAGNGK